MVLCEVGHSSTDEDSEGEISDQVFSVNTRSGKLATTYQTRRFLETLINISKIFVCATHVESNK